MEHFGRIFEAAPVTLEVTATCFTSERCWGVVLVSGRRSRSWVVRSVSRVVSMCFEGYHRSFFSSSCSSASAAVRSRSRPFQAAVIGLGLISLPTVAEI